MKPERPKARWDLKRRRDLRTHAENSSRSISASFGMDNTSSVGSASVAVWYAGKGSVAGSSATSWYKFLSSSLMVNGDPTIWRAISKKWAVSLEETPTGETLVV